MFRGLEWNSGMIKDGKPHDDDESGHDFETVDEASEGMCECVWGVGIWGESG